MNSKQPSHKEQKRNPNAFICHEVFYKTNHANPFAVKLMIEKANNWLVKIPGALEVKIGIPYDTGRAISAKDYDCVLKMAFKSPLEMQSYMQHPDHLKWVDWVLTGWMIKGSSLTTSQERHQEFIDQVLHGKKEFEWTRDPQVPEERIVWAGEKVYDYLA